MTGRKKSGRRPLKFDSPEALQYQLRFQLIGNIKRFNVEAITKNETQVEETSLPGCFFLSTTGRYPTRTVL